MLKISCLKSSCDSDSNIDLNKSINIVEDDKYLHQEDNINDINESQYSELNASIKKASSMIFKFSKKKKAVKKVITKITMQALAMVQVIL